MPTLKLPSLLRLLGHDVARAELISSFCLNECVARLRQNTNSAWAFFGPAPVNGHVGDETFRLYKKKPFLGGKYDPAIMRGNFIEEAQQTRILCRFGLAGHAVAGNVAASFVAILIIATMLVQMRTTPTSAATLIPATIASLALIGTIWLTHRRRLRDERLFLLAFVIATLEAREVPLSSVAAHKLGHAIFLEQIRGEP